MLEAIKDVQAIKEAEFEPKQNPHWATYWSLYA